MQPDIAGAAQRNQVEGTVSAVLFRNEENGYTVLKLDCGERGEITAVGCMPGAAPGEALELEGSWGRHPSYGEQFKAEVVTRRMPVGEKAIFEYLASGVVKGVRMGLARQIVDRFGEDALAVIENEPDKLCEIRGVSPKRARAISEDFRQKMGMRRLAEFLSEHRLPLAAAMPLYQRFGDYAVEVVRDNPYLLADRTLEIPFAQVDELAIGLGVAGDDPQRVEAALIFELDHNADNGHVFLPENKLLTATAALIGVEGDCLAQGLDGLIERGEVVREDIAGVTACYPAGLYGAECYVAMRLGEMCRTEIAPPEGLGRLIDAIQKEQGIRYAKQQRTAVELCASRQVMLLTGGPGTGKTTSLRGVLALFETLGLETALTAPTGRAAKRMGETCGTDALTIHRLLETKLDPFTGQLAFTKNQDDPLEVDAVIVDETSMVDVSLMAALLAALRGDCRLVLVGDPDQLPSVGPGNVLRELLRCGLIPTVHLDIAYRQKNASRIALNAHTINEGDKDSLAYGEDFRFLPAEQADEAAQIVLAVYQEAVTHQNLLEVQILAPFRSRGECSVKRLNEEIQKLINPPDPCKKELKYGTQVFRELDKVIQTKNREAVSNGDVGLIVSITQDEEEGDTVRVLFSDERAVDYSAEELSQLELAYATTIHKSQGSEYHTVIIPILKDQYIMLRRNLIYTAVSRAKQQVSLVGQKQALHIAIDRNDVDRRNTLLADRIVSYYRQMNAGKSKISA